MDNNVSTSGDLFLGKPAVHCNCMHLHFTAITQPLTGDHEGDTASTQWKVMSVNTHHVVACDGSLPQNHVMCHGSHCMCISTTKLVTVAPLAVDGIIY